MTVDVPASGRPGPVTTPVHDDEGRAPALRSTRRAIAVGLAALSLLLSLRYALGGVGYVLDDWYTLGRGAFDGSWSSAGPDQWRARPGAGVLYALVFGALGGHPLAAFGLLAALGAATAAALFLVLDRHLPRRPAVIASVIWVVLPNHTSLEVWLSAVNIAVALLLVVLGCLVVGRDDGRHRALAGGAFLVATLSYEAVIPVVALAAIALPWIERRRLDVRTVLAVGVPQVAAAGWIVANWHPAKRQEQWADLSQVPAAHFGWGVLPAGPVADLALLVGVVGTVALVGRLILRPAARGPVGWAVPAGLAIIAVGVAPFVRYFYAPIGAGDRFNCVSAIGGALLWAAIVELLWERRREVAAVGLGVLLLFGMVARWDRGSLWTDAAADALAIRDHVVRTVPEPGDDDLVVGPTVRQVDNIAAFLDRSNIEPALRLGYGGREVGAVMAFSADAFEEIPADRRVDVSDVVRLGERCDPVSDRLGTCDGRPGR